MENHDYHLSWSNPVTQTAADLTLAETLVLSDKSSNELPSSINITCTIDNPNVIFTASQSQTWSGDTNVIGRLPVSVQCLSNNQQDFTLNAYLTSTPSVTVQPPLSAKFTAVLKVASVNLQPRDSQAAVNSPVTLTATVTGSDQKVMPNTSVIFSANAAVTLEPKTATTNQQGQAITKVTGNNAGLITVTAAAGEKSDTVNLDFEYPVNSVTLDPSDIQRNIGTPVNIIATVKGTDNHIKQNVPVTFSATNGATVSPQIVNTDSTGLAVTTVYNNNSGVTTVKGEAAGKSGSAQITYIAVQDYYLTLTPDSTRGVVSDMYHGDFYNTVTATLLDRNKKPVANQTVYFSADSGLTVSPASAVTDSNGQAQTKVQSRVPGQRAINGLAEGETAATYITYRALV
ncbi:Ig-like domain-containing protein [Enterobacteriaceae bacterium LUAb1]